jgi:rhamnulokinase
MYSPVRRDWCRGFLDDLAIPTQILQSSTQPGTLLSNVQPQILDECGLPQPFPVIAVASHDTASAVAAIPNMDEHSAFLSSGTWSLMGIETAAPDLSEEARRLGFTNEGAADGTCLLLRNITGLWVLQECQRQWASESHHYSWNELVSAATNATPFQCLIDIDAPDFQTHCDMPRAISQYCKESRQIVPETVGAIARCSFESLSLKYRSVFESLRKLSGRTLQTIRVVGGGGLNAMLCQMTADACDCPVVVGPAEASTLGNVMLQAVATGDLSDVRSGRAAIARSVQCSVFEPHHSDRWDAAFARFSALENRVTMPAR